MINAIKINYIRAKINNTQQNCKCRLCGDRDDTVNHIISECSKLAQKKYKSRHDWVGKVIYGELCKRLEFDHANRWICTNQNLPYRMKCVELTEISRYKRITQSRPEDKTYCLSYLPTPPHGQDMIQGQFLS